jgi:uncharacterized protein
MTDAEFAQLEAELFDEYPLPLAGLHGALHWRRVDHWGRLLAAHTGADLHVVRRFALLHDSQRFTEGCDPDHGLRAAQRAHQYCADELTREQMQLLWLACEGHSRGLCSDDPTIGTCWDADRLDLERMGITPCTASMSTTCGRQLAEQKAAQRPAEPPPF